MSGNAEAAQRDRPWVRPSPLLFTIVYVALLVLLALTWWVAHLDLGPWNPVLAIVIAVLKAGLVALFFMHVAWDDPLTRVLAALGFLFLALLIGLTLADALHRG